MVTTQAGRVELKAVAWWIILVIIITFQGAVRSDQIIPKPRSCDASETWFAASRRFVYKYKASVDAGSTGTSDVTSGSSLSCDLTINVPKPCEVTLKLSKCELKEKRLNGKLSRSPRSNELAMLLERHEVYVQMDRGHILQHEMVVYKEEPVYISNIKRAIVSQLQLPILPSQEYDQPVLQQDLFGNCTTHFHFDPETESVNTRRDVSQCLVNQIFGLHRSWLSVARQLQKVHQLHTLDALTYPFESPVDCQYKVANKRILHSTCVHSQLFRPLTIDGKLKTVPTVNVTQSLTFATSSKLTKRSTFVSRSLDNRTIVGLTMELQDAPARDVTSSHLHEGLDQILLTYSVQSDDIPPEKFRTFVDLLRQAQQSAIEEALETLLSCRNASMCSLDQFSDQLDPKVVQNLRESFFADGLLSCGTETCLSVYMVIFQRNMIFSFDGELTLLNMALFYTPDPGVLSKMLELCQSTMSSNCWLSLGTLVSKMAKQLRTSQEQIHEERGKSIIKEVLQHLGDSLGDTCRPGLLPQTEEGVEQKKLLSPLLALKVLGNAGGTIQEEFQDLTQAVLHCLNNHSLPLKITNAAMTVLEKLELTKPIRTALLKILAEPLRPVSMRALAFDRLLRHENRATMEELIGVVSKEKVSSLKIYMITSVGNMLESNLPHTRSLRVLWREVLANRTDPWPQLEEQRGRGSLNAEHSHYLEVPLTESWNGARVGLSLVFEPSSVVPSNIRVSLTFLLDNVVIDLIEVGMDLQGFENIARELLGPGLDFKQGLGAIIAQVMQAVLPVKKGFPTLFFHDKKLMETLRKLFIQINMPTGDAPEAQLRIKIFGSEVVYVYLEDLINLLRVDPRTNEKEPPRFLVLARKLSEGLQVFFGKSSRLLEIVKIIPTVAGFPWHAEVYGTMVASSMFNAGGDIAKFLSRKGPLEINGGLSMSLGVAVLCQMTVYIGEITSSGLRLNMSVDVKGGPNGRLKYAPVPESKNVPGAQVLELGMGALERPLNVVRLRSDLYVLHNGEEKVIQTPGTQETVKKCWSEQLQLWTGQSVCLEGFYQTLNFSGDAALPVLSGPIHLDIMARSSDKSLKEYTTVLTLTRREKEGTPTFLTVFKANCSASGEKLNRTFDVLMTVNPTMDELQVLAVVPEFPLRYAFDLNSVTSSNSSRMGQVSSVLNSGPELLHAFIMETKDIKESQEIVNPNTGETMTLNVSEMYMKVNISFPGISVQVIANCTSGKEPGRFAQALVIRYYCEPQLGILYALHGRPSLVAKSGNLSEWSITNVAVMSGRSLADTWRISDNITILLPGHIVTMSNQLKANNTWATRFSTINWTSDVGTAQETTDVIRMNAEVHNKSVGEVFDVHYIMTLVKEDSYEVFLEGQVKGPLSNLDISTDIHYKQNAGKRMRRSLKDIHQRLKQMEKKVQTDIETAEEIVVRRVSEIAESFISWIARETAILLPTSEGDNATKVPPEAEARSANKTSDRNKTATEIGPLVKLLNRPEWKLRLTANVKFVPKIVFGNTKPVGYECAWDVLLHFPDSQKNILQSNGSLSRDQGWDMDVVTLLHSDLYNFTLDFLMQQNIHYPQVFHMHRWNFVEFTEHRLDRSFTFLIDLERQDHFLYSMDLTSPNVNLSHAINFSTVGHLRTVRASLDVHCENPTLDINYREMSDLTPKGLVTDVNVNSTLADIVLDLDFDWSKRGSIFATHHMDVYGKGPFLNGSHKMDAELKMNMTNRKEIPSLTVNLTNSADQVSTMFGQYLDHHLVRFAFSTRKPGVKAVKLLDWYIRLLEPTLLQHSLQWQPNMTQTILERAERFYRSGAHSFKVFGETVADNVYRNVTDMAVPFTNMTISDIVDRVARGQMKAVSRCGLDPRKNVPLMVKILKGGLRVIQGLQTAWHNSKLGRLVAWAGIPRLLSGAAWLSTRLHYMVVQDPPSPLRQFVKFRILPVIARSAASRQFNFTVPLPFVWDRYLKPPRPFMLSRLRKYRADRASRAQSDLLFIAIVSRNQIQTFDGSSYNITVPSQFKCTYLLATDLVIRNHSLLLTDHSAAVAMREASVDVAWDGAVKIRGQETVVKQLPAYLINDRARVILKEGQLTVGIPGQLRMTYDPVSEIYVIETAWHAHNRSIGLLGTNTLEAGDDFQLPSGRMASETVQFQEQYELSGNEACRKVQQQNSTSSSSCDASHQELCWQLFEQPSSPLAPCFSVINPTQFLDLCLMRTCQETANKSSNACPVVSSFVKMCAARGQMVSAETSSYLSVCDDCRGSGALVNKLDLVFGWADSSFSSLPSIINNIATELEKEDARFGFVYSQEEDSTQAHLFDGQLLVTGMEMKSKVNWSEVNSLNQSPEMAAILELASNYPFRPGARRFIILIAGQSRAEMVGLKELQQILWNRDISLALVSSDLEEQRVQAVTWDQQVICRGCIKDQVSMPTTEVGQLASATRGLWMSLEIVEQGQRVRTRMRRVLEEFLRVTRQPPPRCAGKVINSENY